MIDLDPQFVEPTASADVRLSAGSPCIDAADNTAVPPGVLKDLDGYARFIDDPNTPDTGMGPPPLVDMGAYEFGGAPVPGDVNCDGSVTVADVEAIVAVLLGLDDNACHVAAADLNGDGKPNGADIQGLIDAVITP